MYDFVEYVYVLTHVATGKKYVGRTVHPEMRKSTHYSLLNTGHHKCVALQHDYDTLGHELTFEIVGKNIRNGREFDTEKKLMVELKTYDERYGYNTQDWAMNPIRKAHGLSYKKSNFKGKGKNNGRCFIHEKGICHSVTCERMAEEKPEQ